jgi:hypothetical protein|tara:strand:- start:3973 stop:4560 length:588 start_codon:yes stop_codon:yes gene_type:complete
MANRFDETNAPEGEPGEIVAGDFVSWKRTGLASDYPPASFSAEYVARITAGGASEIKIAGTERDSYYWFTAASSVSANFTPGRYHWQLEVTQTATGNRVAVDRGEFSVIVDLDVNGTDPRVHAEIMLDKIESVLENRADGDVSTYTIAGRSLTKMTPQELIDWRDVYRREVVTHRRRLNIKLGKKGRATILGRFI